VTALALIGAVVLTGVLLYFTLGFISLMLMSDESLWHTISWNWPGIVMWLVPLVTGWVFWWFLVAMHISIAIV